MGLVITRPSGLGSVAGVTQYGDSGKSLGLAREVIVKATKLNVGATLLPVTHKNLELKFFTVSGKEREQHPLTIEYESVICKISRRFENSLYFEYSE